MTGLSRYAEAEIRSLSQKALQHISSAVEMAVWEAFSYQTFIFFLVISNCFWGGKKPKNIPLGLQTGKADVCCPYGGAF